MRPRGLRLPLPRRPDPVLTDDELDWIAHLLREHIESAEQQMARERVSESVIRGQMYAESALAKVEQVRDV